jgi:hypothetical protein
MHIERETKQKGEGHERLSTENERETKGYKDRGEREKYRAVGEEKKQDKIMFILYRIPSILYFYTDQ